MSDAVTPAPAVVDVVDPVIVTPGQRRGLVGVVRQQAQEAVDAIRIEVQVRGELPPGTSEVMVNDDFGDVFGLMLVTTFLPRSCAIEVMSESPRTISPYGMTQNMSSARMFLSGFL